MTYIVLMGGPGAGKGTQASLLNDQLELPLVASGDLFRKNMQKRTKLGRVAKSFIDAGELVPDEVTVGMVKERLSRADCKDGALLDGFPRTIRQAEALDEIMAEMGAVISLVPYIHVDGEVLLRRLSGRWTCKECGHNYHVIFKPPQVPGICDYDGSPLYQREDDTIETQRRRIVVYFEQTTPLLDYYRKRNLLIEVDGRQSIEEVNRDLLSAIRLEAGA
jgi:adenylate kinase